MSTEPEAETVPVTARTVVEIVAGYALILGLILGPIAETGFAQGLIIGHGSYSVFFTRGPCQILWAVIVLLLIPPLVQVYRNHFRRADA